MQYRFRPVQFNLANPIGYKVWKSLEKANREYLIIEQKMSVIDEKGLTDLNVAVNKSTCKWMLGWYEKVYFDVPYIRQHGFSEYLTNIVAIRNIKGSVYVFQTVEASDCQVNVYKPCKGGLSLILGILVYLILTCSLCLAAFLDLIRIDICLTTCSIITVTLAALFMQRISLTATRISQKLIPRLLHRNVEWSILKRLAKLLLHLIHLGLIIAHWYIVGYPVYTMYQMFEGWCYHIDIVGVGILVIFGLSVWKNSL